MTGDVPHFQYDVLGFFYAVMKQPNPMTSNVYPELSYSLLGSRRAARRRHRRHTLQPALHAFERMWATFKSILKTPEISKDVDGVLAKTKFHFQAYTKAAVSNALVKWYPKGTIPAKSWFDSHKTEFFKTLDDYLSQHSARQTILYPLTQLFEEDPRQNSTADSTLRGALQTFERAFENADSETKEKDAITTVVTALFTWTHSQDIKNEAAFAWIHEMWYDLLYALHLEKEVSIDKKKVTLHSLQTVLNDPKEEHDERFRSYVDEMLTGENLKHHETCANFVTEWLLWQRETTNVEALRWSRDNTMSLALISISPDGT